VPAPLEDAAQSHPDAIWPGQAAGALRSLIHTANNARDQGLVAIPDDAASQVILPLPKKLRTRTVTLPRKA
jgi:hypothetical protein